MERSNQIALTSTPSEQENIRTTFFNIRRSAPHGKSVITRRLVIMTNRLNLV